MHMIRLLALDIDDTLVDSSLRISDGNRDAISDVLRHRVTVVLASGRGYLGTKPVRDALALTTPAIVYGGAVIMDGKTDSILHAEYLDEADVRACFEIADRYSLHAQIYEGDTVVFRAENEFTRRYTANLHLPFRVDPDMLQKPLRHVPKVLLYVDPQDQEKYLAVLKKELPVHLHALTSKPGFLEIGGMACTKGTALKWLAEHLRIPREEVAAIGDNTLDLDMIRWAGVGCCVANGNAAVQAESDLVLPSCEDDGVAHFIRTYIPGC